jgi:protoheme IX farnesyltransferase
LSLNRTSEYARAGVPMLPVVAGRVETTRQILIYSILLFPVSLLPWALGFAGAIYGTTVAVFGATFVALALRLARSSELDRRPAHRLFAFSILYLFVLFAALFADNSSDRSSLTVSAHAAPASVGPVDASQREAGVQQ